MSPVIMRQQIVCQLRHCPVTRRQRQAQGKYRRKYQGRQQQRKHCRAKRCPGKQCPSNGAARSAKDRARRRHFVVRNCN
jgi:hypothetical protein